MGKHLHTTWLLLVVVSSHLATAQPINAASKNAQSNVLSIAYFIESANHSLNSLNSLLKKDNYRNKIVTLNNPTGNELGFNLKSEIMTALTPLLEKAKTTDKTKFQSIIESLFTSEDEEEESGLAKFLPKTGLFSTILSLVGNLVITEKKITKDDLSVFVNKIQQYLYQYEKLNSVNLQFSNQLQKLLLKTEEMKGDVKDFLVESAGMIDTRVSRTVCKPLAVETIMLAYYDPQNLQNWFDTARVDTARRLFPTDAGTTVKTLASGIKKLQKEFESIYSENYTALKDLLIVLKSTPNIDQKQLAKTNADIDLLYSESKQADVINLNLNLVDERMNTLCRLFNNR